jgi:hypothetical protein
MSIGSCLLRIFVFQSLWLRAFLVSRFAVTATYAGLTDRHAVVGWDPNLATYFLQAFQGEREEGLRLGETYGEFPTPDALAKRCAVLGVSLFHVSGGVPEEHGLGAELNAAFSSVFSGHSPSRYNDLAAL